MLSQESGRGRGTVLEEASEASIPGIGWRAEARARRSYTIRGGIQASHPGFRKTICSLALIATDFQDCEAEEIISRFATIEQQAVTFSKPNTSRDFQTARGKQANTESIKQKPLAVTGIKDVPEEAALLKLAATLVIAPKHLTKQWQDEVKKILGATFADKTIMISGHGDLLRHMPTSFAKARIIIVNQDVLTTEPYVKRLAQFSGVPEPTTNKGREYKSWLRFATTEIPTHLKMLQTKGSKILANHLEKRILEHLKDESFLAVVPSKRLKGKDYAKQDQSSKAARRSANMSQSATIDRAHVDKCLFEMFHFNRIIVDEFTYLTAKDFASILSLKADKRWALSATARLQDPCDIAKMASLIGIKIRVGKNAPGAVSMRNLRAMWDESTDFERFQTFREAPSAAITQRTYKLAQNFLNDFVRQNVLEFDDFPYNDYIVPVTLGITHRIVYTELSQHLISQDMRIKRTNKARAEARDRDLQLHENLKDVESAEEALSRLAAFAETSHEVKASDAGKVIFRRKHQCGLAVDRLSEAVLDGQKFMTTYKGTETMFEVWKTTVSSHQSLGDAETSNFIKELIVDAEKRYPSPPHLNHAIKKNKTNNDEDSDTAANPKGPKDSNAIEKIRELTSRANDLAKHFLACQRSLRFVSNAQSIIGKQSPTRVCQTTVCCSSKSIAKDMAVSSLCGHLICSPCFAITQTNNHVCGAAGCNAPVERFHLLRASKMPAAEDTEPGANDAHGLGAKVSAVIDLLKSMHSARDQAILFVRYEDQIDAVERACRSAGIICTAVRDNNQAAKLIETFQKNTKADKSTVIILNASNASAAGVNLTNANHVLFMSPLLMDMQYDYDAAMAQSVGRARRPGQSKDIHVYRFVALDTIDVDILEHRERRTDSLSEQDASEVATKDTSTEKERSQLIKDKDGRFRLLPRSWLVAGEAGLFSGIEGRDRVKGYEDFSSLIKFSKAYSEED